jgi:exopolyphosphatase/guanosine-5'-triphosphate,3'-diphosphate pyrophosphatase
MPLVPPGAGGVWFRAPVSTRGEQSFLDAQGGADLCRGESQVPESEFGGFPLRVAAIDVGSNALRLLALEFESPNRYVSLGFERVPVRLARNASASRQLAPDAIEHAIQTLARFRTKMDSFGIVHYRAVATSAVRESENQHEFVERVRQEAGIDLDVIDGNEEARLAHLAVCRKVRLGHRIWMLADVGGGSVEVSLVDERGILWSETHAVGSVRLLEKVADGRIDSLRQCIEAFVTKINMPPHLAGTPTGLIAAGGNVVTLASLTGSRPSAEGISTLLVSDLGDAIRCLSTLSPAERVSELGIGPDRADVILPAAMLYQRLAILAGAREILVPNVGVREGVALDVVEALCANSSRAA